MSRFCWWLVEIVCGVLEPGERDAVRGDFAESGESAGRALREVLGLAARRQSALWKHWRSWSALVCLVVPLGMLLCLVSRRTADGNAIHIWLYANNWDWSFLGNAAFRHDFVYYVGVVFIEYLTLFCWSWSSGFVLGSASGGSLSIHGLLFVIVLLLGEFLGAPPRHFGYALFYRARDLPNNAAVFQLTFYSVIFPLIVRLFLVLVPSVWGMRQALSAARLPPLLRTILGTAAIATLGVIAIRTGLAPVPYVHPGSLNRSQAPLLQLVVYWPIGYLILSAIGRRRHGWIASF